MKLQQPLNRDFRVSQCDPLRSQSSNDRETTTSPPGHHWEVLRGKCCTHNDRQTTTTASQQPWNDDFCRIVQRPRNATTVKWQVRNCTLAANFASDFASLCGCCRFKCLLEVSEDYLLNPICKLHPFASFWGQNLWKIPDRFSQCFQSSDFAHKPGPHVKSTLSRALSPPSVNVFCQRHRHSLSSSEGGMGCLPRWCIPSEFYTLRN